MPNQKLEEYVKNSLGKGVPRAEILKALLDLGWDKKETDEAFAKFIPTKKYKARTSHTPSVIVRISYFIRTLSALYFVFALLVLFSFFTSYLPGLAIGFIALFILPITFFGIPIDPTLQDMRYSEWIPILLSVLIGLSAIAYWSAVEIKKLRFRGLLIYSTIVTLLLVGLLLDILFGDGLPTINIFSVVIVSFFMWSVIRLWYDFKKLGVLSEEGLFFPKIIIAFSFLLITLASGLFYQYYWGTNRNSELKIGEIPYGSLFIRGRSPDLIDAYKSGDYSSTDTLYRIFPDGRRETLVENTKLGYGVKFSPDTKKVVIKGTFDGFSIYNLVSRKGIDFSDKFSFYNGFWDFDSKYFISINHDDGAVYKIDTETFEETYIMPASKSMRRFKVSPNSDLISFLKIDVPFLGGGTLAVVDKDGENERILRSDISSLDYFWSSDGKSLFFFTDADNFVKFDLATFNFENFPCQPCSGLGFSVIGFNGEDSFYFWILQSDPNDSRVSPSYRLYKYSFPNDEMEVVFDAPATNFEPFITYDMKWVVYAASSKSVYSSVFGGISVEGYEILARNLETSKVIPLLDGWQERILLWDTR